MRVQVYWVIICYNKVLRFKACNFPSYFLVTRCLHSSHGQIPDWKEVPALLMETKSSCGWSSLGLVPRMCLLEAMPWIKMALWLLRPREYAQVILIWLPRAGYKKIYSFLLDLSWNVFSSEASCLRHSSLNSVMAKPHGEATYKSLVNSAAEAQPSSHPPQSPKQLT